jgi:hypothetical protein
MEDIVCDFIDSSDDNTVKMNLINTVLLEEHNETCKIDNKNNIYINMDVPEVWRRALCDAPLQYINIVNRACQLGFLHLLKISWIKKNKLVYKYKKNLRKYKTIEISSSRNYETHPCGGAGCAINGEPDSLSDCDEIHVKSPPSHKSLSNHQKPIFDTLHENYYDGPIVSCHNGIIKPTSHSSSMDLNDMRHSSSSISQFFNDDEPFSPIKHLPNDMSRSFWDESDTPVDYDCIRNSSRFNMYDSDDELPFVPRIYSPIRHLSSPVVKHKDDSDSKNQERQNIEDFLFSNDDSVMPKIKNSVRPIRRRHVSMVNSA